MSEASGMMIFLDLYHSISTSNLYYFNLFLIMEFSFNNCNVNMSGNMQRLMGKVGGTEVFLFKLQRIMRVIRQPHVSLFFRNMPSIGQCHIISRHS